MPISKDTPRLPQDEIIASREYLLGEDRIDIRIGKPRLRPDGRFECVAELDEGDVVSSKPMNGVDAFEALQLALMLIGIELSFIKSDSGKSLTWAGGSRRDLGVPTGPDFSLRELMQTEHT